ncbi:MAG: hypothetical protein JNJ83_10655 [Verrucomicrobiaceae bacterium]|nr:hypothetical protein [Verrucomicrobiaceae bacterium]
MIEHAQNPNTRNQAARTLGRIIHELGTREGVRWKQNLIDSNEEFKNAVFPYGPGGGKPPKDDLIRWVRAEMTSLERLWLIAAKVAHRVSIGTFRTLRASWEYYLQGRPRQLSHHERELSNHPFAQLDFAALSDFRLLWDSALCQLFKAKWNREKKNRELDIQGEKSFPKRFGDQNHPEAGYFAAERHFNRWWRTKLESAIRTEKLIRERHTARQRELMNRPPESRSIDEEVELAEIQALIEEV